MKISNVVFPTDFSQHNDAAMHFASALAADAGAVLHIVHVDDMLDVSAGLADAGYPYTWAPEMADRTELQERLSQVVPPHASVRYEHHYLKGPPVSEIVKLAERQKADLIVMASHGRTGLQRLLMGSIAEGVLRRAPCPVLVVKQPSGAGDPEAEAASRTNSNVE